MVAARWFGNAPSLVAVRHIEKRLIVEALEATGHNQFQTAMRLGISRSGLLKKMRRLGLK